MSAKRRTSKRLSGRFAVFITILLFVCSVIFLNNRITSGSLKRISYWIFNGVRGDATDASIGFDANEYNKFTIINGNLCVISPEKLSAYKLSGKATLDEPVLLRSPAVSASKSRFAAYDLGGLNFHIANAGKVLYSGTTDAQILNINMNNSGDFAVVTDDVDCKSLVTVYNSKFETVYKFHSSEKYVFDAAVSSGGKSVAVAAYGTENGSFNAELLLGKTGEDSFYATVSLGSSMPLDLSYRKDGKIFLICNDRSLLISDSGDISAEISHEDLPLKSFTSTDGKHTALLLDNYQNGGNTKLLLVSGNGSVQSMDIEDDVYSISCAGSYVSVQYADKCVVYNSDLTQNSEFMIPASVTRCIVNNDGSVLSIGDNFAMLYVK
ncbi:MAG: hypothetical protein IJ299_05235 [Oscillospiraceae bacterium]|nr:hypothetical protein [Oscillospiraceae bacterium]